MKSNLTNFFFKQPRSGKPAEDELQPVRLLHENQQHQSLQLQPRPEIFRRKLFGEEAEP